MSHSLLLSRCINTPLLIEEAKLNILTSDVFLKLLVDEPIDRSKSTPEKVEVSNPLENIAVISIYGELVNKNGAGASGITSYEGIRSDILSAIYAGYTRLVFDISSPGGEAGGNFSLAAFIKSLPEKYGIHTYGFTDSIAASGGYSLLAATEKIYATDMAMVGSIGAVASLVDTTKKDEKEGLRYEIIRSREHKQIYNPHEGITDKARKEILTHLKAWDIKFFNTIIEYRPNITTEILDKLDGGVVNATEGLTIGLVDQIVTSIDEIFPDIIGKDVNTTKKGIIMATHEETLAQLVDVQAQLAALKASTELDIKTAVQAERERGLKILEAQKTFGISTQMASNAISKGFSLDLVTEMFTEVKANMDEMAKIDTSTAGVASVNAITAEQIAALGQKQNEAATKTLGGGMFSMSDLLTEMANIGGNK